VHSLLIVLLITALSQFAFESDVSDDSKQVSTILVCLVLGCAVVAALSSVRASFAQRTRKSVESFELATSVADHLKILRQFSTHLRSLPPEEQQPNLLLLASVQYAINKMDAESVGARRIWS
jgi:hypothetical protein